MGEPDSPLLNEANVGGAGKSGASPVPAVSMRQITKRFPGVLANDCVDFEAAAFRDLRDRNPRVSGFRSCANC